MYPKAQNVEFSGEFTDSKIEWFYSLDDTRGVYITGTFIQLNDEYYMTTHFLKIVFVVCLGGNMMHYQAHLYET